MSCYLSCVINVSFTDSISLNFSVHKIIARHYFKSALFYRFLRHVPIVYVDYPGETSLKQIYGTFNRAMLRLLPSLRTYSEPLTAAMVEFYLMSQVIKIRLKCCFLFL